MPTARRLAAAFLTFGCFGLSALAADAPPAPKPLVEGAEVITLWPAGSPMLKPDKPGFSDPEKWNFSKNDPTQMQSVVNIHNPSIEVHLPPADKANGCAIVVIAGGGNTTCNVGGEGVDIAKWLNDKGIAAFIERYRLKPYAAGVDALADTQQSVRIVRANAEKWHIDPHRIGVMGFSAGGEQCAWIESNFDEGKPDSKDPIEKASCRPDFNVMVYAGWARMDMDKIPANAPPTFFMCAGLDDSFHAKQTVQFYEALFKAKIPVELHIYAHGGHGGGIKPRKGIPMGTWQVRFEEWAKDMGLFDGKKTPA